MTLSKFLLFIAGLFITIGTQAQVVEEGAIIQFEKDIHDFGHRNQYSDVTYSFSFTNTGTTPLIITQSKGSCGCTTPEWPRHPIPPGKTEKIKVRFDSKKVGPFNKSVSITSNATNAPTKVIRIKGNIVASPNNNSPQQRSVSPAPPNGE